MRILSILLAAVVFSGAGLSAAHALSDASGCTMVSLRGASLQLTNVTGDVLIRSGNTYMKVTEGMVMPVGAELLTGPNSSVALDLTRPNEPKNLRAIRPRQNMSLSVTQLADGRICVARTQTPFPANTATGTSLTGVELLAITGLGLGVTGAVVLGQGKDTVSK